MNKAPESAIFDKPCIYALIAIKVNRISDNKYMKKNIIELSDAEHLVLFDFLSRICDVEWEKWEPVLYKDLAEKEVLLAIKCELESKLSEPFDGDYKKILEAARKTVRDNY